MCIFSIVVVIVARIIVVACGGAASNCCYDQPIAGLTIRVLEVPTPLDTMH